jgi:hypothetical protein
MAGKKANATADSGAKGKGKGTEPVFIIKPVKQNWGLDYLHISLIVLIVILVGVAFALSDFHYITPSNTIPANTVNSVSGMPIHTQAQALAAAERYLAGYSDINSTLAILPYYTLVNQSSISYSQSSKDWVFIAPYLDPLNNQTYKLSMVLYDSNLTLANAYTEMLSPFSVPNDTVVAPGTVMMDGKAVCSYKRPFPVYLVVDPYAPGAISSMGAFASQSGNYSGTANFSYVFAFTGYAARYYSSYGIAQTQDMGRYALCASQQQGHFQDYLSNLSIDFHGAPIANYTLSYIAAESELNMTRFNSCLYNSTSTLDAQATLTKLYGINATPEDVVNCKYIALPQTLSEAIKYANRTIG